MTGPDESPVDPGEVDTTEREVERLRAGQRDPADPVSGALADWRDEVRRPISGWVEDPSAPSGWSWVPDLSVLPTPVQDRMVLPAVHRGGERLTYQDAIDYRRAHWDAPVDVPPRVDDWCEDRPLSDLTDDDGVD